MEKKTILFVDDDMQMLKTGEDILIEAGYEVSLAKSGLQALKLIEKGRKFDLVLLDVNMPEIDGYETFLRIREHVGFETTPIIFLTGMDDPDSEIRGLEMGAADYVVKPFIKAVLIARVNRWAQPILKNPGEKEINEEKLKELEKVLTSVELSIVKLIAKGYSNQEIADETHYSYTYVKKVVSVILNKLYLKNRIEIRQMLKV